MSESVSTIRDSLFGKAIGARILDITAGEWGEEDQYTVYFHLDNGETLFATIGNEDQPNLMGVLDMSMETEEAD